ncbi:hypothetical protein UFOVP558_36 [uncultured Caudovirales phage]|uniref:Uncharacterized protein n=1 Tax=uncultured Caudovirales phage TaxID=2100421 RepID=A0A6J5MVD1_9CAUD|nr:hypothetical protein UFOVP558_36 [uncultured Caudovirales phage]
MKSSLDHLFDCATDKVTKEKLRAWVDTFVLKMGQTITVTEREILHAADSHESMMKRRIDYAFYNMIRQIQDQKIASSESVKWPNGSIEETISILLVKP